MQKTKISSVLLISTILLSFAVNALAEEKRDATIKLSDESVKKEDSVKLNFNGFIRYDAYYDSRQTTSLREGALYLYPKAIKKTPNGLDENSDNNLNLTSFMTRGMLKISTPDAFGAKVSGYLEGDFFGPSEAQLSSFSLRHSYVNLKWEQVDLLIGQYWSAFCTPMSVVPKTVSYNLGAPFQTFSRNPQVTLSYKPAEIFKVLGSIAMERDGFSEIGGVIKEQRSGIPSLHLQAEVGNSNFLFGAGGFTKTIRPDALAQNFQATSGTVYAKAKLEGFTIQAKGIYGGDLADHLMLGGYALTKEKAVTLNTASGWLDVDYELNKSVSFGIFGGYSANMGASDLAQVTKDATGKDNIFARDQNIASVFRISPRIVYTVEKLKFALEYDYTNALYASSLGDRLQPVVDSSKDSNVANSRIMFSTFLNF
ncbi:MAG: hypothetical protein H7263_04990 [Candidatus Sericytochromatia bacterium]|nr:hypothetical protein [Candidatus Sericytochromatia bacterium]